jgi:hypothetical protein
MIAGEARESLETICCICMRQKGKNGWQETAIESFADLSHGFCPDCYRRTMLDYGLAPGKRLPELERSEAPG